MRISVALIVFLILFNGWAGLMMDYGIDDHLGFNAETGDASELENARENASKELQTGEPLGQTLIGFYNGLLNTLKNVLVGWQPGVQLLVNVLPAGIAQDLVVWAFSIVDIIILVDVAAYARGVDL